MRRMKKILYLLCLLSFSSMVLASCPVEMEYEKLVDCVVSNGAESSGSEQHLASVDANVELEPISLSQCSVDLPYQKLVDCIVAEGGAEDGSEPNHLADGKIDLTTEGVAKK